MATERMVTQFSFFLTNLPFYQLNERTFRKKSMVLSMLGFLEKILFLGWGEGIGNVVLQMPWGSPVSVPQEGH